MEIAKKGKISDSLFLKYCIVGTVAAAVDFSLLYSLTEYVFAELEQGYLTAATIAFIASALLNYYLNRTWTFCSNGSKTRQVPIFFVVAITGLLINNTVLYILVEFAGFWYIVAKIFANGVVLIWNFTGNKYITFKR